MLRAIIVDDESNARMALRGMIESNFEEIEICDEAKNVPEAVKAIHKQKPDLVFLDIEMPGYSGLELLDFFDENEISFKIIFVTAYAEFAIKAFELSAIDYLLKPIKKEHLERVIKKVHQIEQSNLKQLQHNFSQPENPKIAINTSKGVIFIHANNIKYIKADGSYSEIVLSDNTRFVTSKKILHYEKLTSLGYFVRAHRSHILNINYIQKFIKTDGGTVELKSGEVFSVSADKKDLIFSKLEELKL